MRDLEVAYQLINPNQGAVENAIHILSCSFNLLRLIPFARDHFEKLFSMFDVGWERGQL